MRSLDSRYYKRPCTWCCDDDRCGGNNRCEPYNAFTHGNYVPNYFHDRCERAHHGPSPTPAWGPSPVPANLYHHWALIHANSFCSFSLDSNGKYLGYEWITVSQCQALVLADPDCGNIMFGDGNYCACLFPSSESCNAQPSSSGSSVYVWQQANCYTSAVVGYQCYNRQIFSPEYYLGVSEAECRNLCDGLEGCGGIDYYPTLQNGQCVPVSNNNCDPLKQSSHSDAVHQMVTPCEAANCVTTGSAGVGPGHPCVFPFTYGGVAYDACTTSNHGGTAWCSTRTDSSGTHIYGQWGDCVCQVPRG